MNVLNLFFGFRGRIGRGTWWLCLVINVAMLITIGGRAYLQAAHEILAALRAAETIEEVQAALSENSSAISPTFVIGLTLLSAWVSFASTVKRFHDRDKSGTWYLVNFVPFGGFWILVECGVLAGTDEANFYGEPGSGMSSESTSSGLDREAVIQSRPRALADERLQRVCSSPRASGVGYAMREEALVMTRTHVPQPATGFGRRNNFR